MGKELNIEKIIQKPIIFLSSAGTGKTTSLTKDFYETLVALNFDADRILAITFTENAAEEMREKISKSLLTQLGKRGLKLAQAIRVSTIDAFYRRELSEKAFLAGVEPDFAILEESEAVRLQRYILMHIFRDKYGNANAGSSALIRLLHYNSYFTRYEYSSTLENAILTLYAKLRAYGVWNFSGLQFLVEELDFEKRMDDLCKFCQELMELNPEEMTTEFSRDVLRNVQSKIIDFTRNIKTLRADEETFYRLIEILDSFNLKGSEQLRKILKPLQEKICLALSAIVSAEDPAISGEVIALLAELEKRYTERKEGLNSLDFADLGIKFFRLVSENENVSKAYKSRFKKIFVDEFQDFNPLQIKTLNLISNACAQYLVGDPKQSIFGFRYANPRGMLLKKQEYQESGGTLIHLTKNYRSRPEILEFVNLFFRDVICRENENALGFEYDPLESGSSFAKKAEKSVTIFYHPQTEERLSGSELVELEAKQVANLIKEKVEGGGIFTTKDNKRRPLSYGDFAVILRRSKYLPLFERALSESIIPFVSEMGRGFLETSEVRAIFTFLKFLLTPEQDDFCAEVLRSDIVGISTNSLYEVFSRLEQESASPKGAIIDLLVREPQIVSSEADRLALLEFINWLTDLNYRIPRMNPCEVLEAVISASRLREKICAYANTYRPELNLEKLLHIATSIDGYGLTGIYRFAKELEELQYQAFPVGQMWMAEEGFVRLLTVHAAKGLTFGAVVIADVNFESPQRENPLICLQNSYGQYEFGINHSLATIGKSLLRGRAHILEPQYDSVRKKIELQEREEELRLLYVALTRAVEYLAIVGIKAFGKSKEDVPWGGFLSQLIAIENDKITPASSFNGILEALPISLENRAQHAEEPSKPSWNELVAINSSSVTDEIRQRANELLKEASFTPDLSRYERYIYSVSEFLSYRESKEGLPKPEQAKVSRSQEFSIELEDFYAYDGAFETRRKLGSLVHSLLAYGIDFILPTYKEGFIEVLFKDESAIQSLLQDEGSGELLPSAKKLVEAFSKTSLFQRLVHSEWRKTETSFLISFGETLFRGKADLIFMEQNRLYLVDYKTDDTSKISLEELTKIYSYQLLFYTYAVSQLLSGFKVEPYLCFLDIPEVRRVEITDEDFASLKVEVDDFIKIMKQAYTSQFLNEARLYKEFYF